jgi:hypothetical protein
MFEDQATLLAAAGHWVSVIDIERLSVEAARIVPPLPPSASVMYRGWMLAPDAYAHLVESIERQDASPFTTNRQYLAAHHLPNWYPLISDLTPETVVLNVDDDLVTALRSLGWTGFFIKDYVKSLKTSVGSLIERPEDIEVVVSEMEKYRGAIEGGICVRRVETFLPNSETRYFVVDGEPFGPTDNDPVPDIVTQCAARIESRFFSVDVAVRDDGVLRVVEVGDGQVSDLVGWTAARFVSLWQRAD